MFSLCILITTTNSILNKSNVFNFVRKNNVNGNFIIGNQSKIKEGIISGTNYILINSNSTGCSLNRNSILKYCTSDLVLFSDDDQIYVNNYEQIILDEFEKNPKTDAIYFKVDVHSDDRPVRMFDKNGRARWKDLSPLGVWGLVIKREVINKYNLFFNENFGPGTDCPMGEDSIYLRELLKHTKNVYLCSKKIADITQEQSTWFKGYDKQFFINIGKVNRFIYPKTFFYHVVKNSIYYFLKFKINPFKVIKWMYQGKRNAK